MKCSECTPPARGTNSKTEETFVDGALPLIAGSQRNLGTQFHFKFVTINFEILNRTGNWFPS